MKAYLIRTIYGVLLLDENGDLIDYRTFEPNELIDKNLEALSGKVLPEEKELIDKYKDKYDKIIVEKPFDLDDEKLAFDPSIVSLKKRAIDYLIDLGIISSKDEYNEKLLEISKIFTKSKIKRRYSEPDMAIVHCGDTIEDLDKIINLLNERLREFYNLYFPELDNLVEDHKTYVVLVSELLTRENFTKDKLKELKSKYDLKLSEDLIKEIEYAAKYSMGGDVEEDLLEIFKDLAENIKSLMATREKIVKVLDKYTSKYTPNLRAILSSTIIAKLLSTVGSLERLASLPASSIQVIGAEKALFRHLKKGTKPPKHGIIFQVPEVRFAPKKLRGKIARAIATKISIAAKADAFTKRDISEKIKKDLEKRLEEIRKSSK